MEAHRKDAQRNRLRIIEAAREALAQGEPLMFNAIARAAGTGVGTVYRHFASIEALEETLVADRFDELGEILRRATPSEIGGVLQAYLSLLVSDPLFERVTSRAQPALDSTVEHRQALIGSLSTLVEGGKSEGLVRRDLNGEDLLALLCGLAHSERTLGIESGSPRGRLLLGILMDGLSDRGRRISGTGA